MPKIPTTVTEFAQACAPLTQDEIYNLFENEIGQPLRDTIYEISAACDTPEPARCAFIMIGGAHGIQSLIDF